MDAKQPQYSICILTGVRIKLALAIDYSDATYNLIDFGLLSSFEFYLGNLTACLPLLAPAISKISSSMKGSVFSEAFFWTRRSTRRLISRSSRKSLKDTSFDKASGNSGEHAFERLDDLGYPLVNNPHLQNDVTASFDNGPLPDLPKQTPQAIQVISGFSLQSNKPSEMV